MCDLAPKQIADSRQPDVRMWQYIKTCSGYRLYIYRSGMIHKNERSNHSSLSKRQYSFYIHPRCNGCMAGFYNNVEHSGGIAAKDTTYQRPLYVTICAAFLLRPEEIKS